MSQTETLTTCNKLQGRLFPGSGDRSIRDYEYIENKPAINGHELHAGENSLDDIGAQPKGEYVTQDDFEQQTQQLQEDIKDVETSIPSVEEFIDNVEYDDSNGIITFYKQNGTTIDIDLPSELIIKGGRYDSQTKEIILELANGDEIRISAKDLIDEYYADNATLELVNINGKQTFKVKDDVFAKQEDMNGAKHDIENLTELVKENQDNITQLKDDTTQLKKDDIDKFEVAKTNGDGLITINAITKGEQSIQAFTIYNGLDGKYPYSAASGQAVNDLNMKYDKLNSQIGNVNDILDYINGEVI